MEKSRSLSYVWTSHRNNVDAPLDLNDTQSWWSQISNDYPVEEDVYMGAVCTAGNDKEKDEARGLVLVSSLPSLICSTTEEQGQVSPFLGGVDERTTSSREGYVFGPHGSQAVDSGDRKPMYSDSVSTSVFSFKDLLRFLGPGWLVAMAYVDPGNLEGDLVAGAVRDPLDAAAGYRLLWVLVCATLMGFLFQRLAIKLGTATGNDLATLCRHQFPRWVAVLLWFNTELCLVGADIQSVIGSAIGLKLICGVPLHIGIIVTLMDSFLVLLVDLWGTKRLEACFAFLISIMAVCFFVNMFTSKPEFQAIATGLFHVTVPTGSASLAVALIGSVVMPHNFFLQSAVVQSRALDRRQPQTIKKVTTIYTLETFFLLFVSLLVNIAVVVAFANPKIKTAAQPLDLYNAHVALETATGQHSAIIWGIGLLAAGQCSTVACTYAGQFIMEGLLELRFPNLWSRIVVTRLASLLPLLFFLSASRSTVETIASAVNVLQAFNLPFVLILLLKFSSSEAVMGSELRISGRTKLVCSFAAACLIGANVCLVMLQLADVSFSLLGAFLTLYFLALAYLWQRPVQPSVSTLVQETQTKFLSASAMRRTESPIFGIDNSPLLSSTTTPFPPDVVSSF